MHTNTSDQCYFSIFTVSLDFYHFHVYFHFSSSFSNFVVLYLFYVFTITYVDNYIIINSLYVIFLIFTFQF